MRRTQQGFTLIELMIVVVIIMILGSIALPQYQQYVNKAKFTEVIAAATPHKIAVELCSMEMGIDEEGMNKCDSGQNGIANPFSQAEGDTVGHVGNIEVIDGTITVTANKNFGYEENPTYQLIPKFSSTSMRWEVGGTCKKAELC